MYAQENLDMRCNVERLRHRLQCILERDGSEEAAITGIGVSISYLFTSDLVRTLDRAIDRSVRA